MISPKLMLFLNFMFAVIFFVAGWFGYDWVFRQVTADLSQSVVAVSPDEDINQRLLISLTFALVGINTGFGAWLIGRVSTWRRKFVHLLLLIIVAIVALEVAIQHQAHSIRALSKSLEGQTGVLNTSIMLSSIHLYQSGVIASGCVLIASVVLALLYKARSSK